jgi:tetratricopeptide (TPR) repeat protein
MTNPSDAMNNMEMPCLSDEDLYNYLTKPEAEVEQTSAATRHLAACSQCREELAGLLRVLHPEDAEAVAEEPSPEETRETVAFIQSITHREMHRSRWYKWGIDAVAALMVIGAISFSLLSLYVRGRSKAFYAQGLASLQRAYEPRSRSDLRLDLPFESEATLRDSENRDELNHAEALFNQAIGVREELREARLGLAYIHLRNLQFSRAQNEFQILLDARKNDAQALLGRGVSRFEEGIAAADPVLRKSRLSGALEDFEAVLKLAPQSVEARYDKVQTLFELGRHELALREIDAYLAQDSESLWAIKLRNL